MIWRFRCRLVIPPPEQQKVHPAVNRHLTYPWIFPLFSAANDGCSVYQRDGLNELAGKKTNIGYIYVYIYIFKCIYVSTHTVYTIYNTIYYEKNI